MNFNLPYILHNGMRILNIVNRTLPLVKEVNPAIGYIRKKIKSINTNITPNNNIKPLSNTNILSAPNKQNFSNSNLTFFK